MDRWLARLELKYGRYALGNLTYYLVGAQAIGFAIALFHPELIDRMVLSHGALARGEWWRLLTFFLYPVSTSPIWALFALYWLYLIGTSLESEWGSLRFEIFWIIGLITTIASVLLGGSTATIAPLIMSLFLAFATLWPDYQIYVFMILPVKVKWLAALDALIICSDIGTRDGWDRLVPLAALANYLLFFGPTLYARLRGFAREGGRARAKTQFRGGVRDGQFNGPRTCAICGKSNTDPTVDIRVCSCEKCGGVNRDLCLEHALNH